jgi:hypothetical protein
MAKKKIERITAKNFLKIIPGRNFHGKRRNLVIKDHLGQERLDIDFKLIDIMTPKKI